VGIAGVHRPQFLYRNLFAKVKQGMSLLLWGNASMGIYGSNVKCVVVDNNMRSRILPAISMP
jgi:hypothetical protein